MKGQFMGMMDGARMSGDYNINFLGEHMEKIMLILGPLFLLFIAWSLFWKGWALWTAVKKDSKVWFIALLLLNTMGILEILYLFVFSKRNNDKKEEPKVSTPQA